jgi:hypothetical protein
LCERARILCGYGARVQNNVFPILVENKIPLLRYEPIEFYTLAGVAVPI